MCPNNCCAKATQHAIIFFSILSFLVLPNAFNFNLHASESSSSHKPQAIKGRGARDVIGSPTSTPSSSGNCANINSATTIDMLTYFLYGVLFATSVALILTAGTKNPSSNSNPKVDIDDSIYSRPHLTVGLSPTVSADEDGGGGGVGYALLRSLPTFAYSKRRGARMGRGISMCVICQSELREQQLVRWLPDCNHLFHLACIDRWLASHSTCPCCRAHLHYSTSPINDDDDDAHNFHYDRHIYGFPF